MNKPIDELVAEMVQQLDARLREDSRNEQQFWSSTRGTPGVMLNVSRSWMYCAVTRRYC